MVKARTASTPEAIRSFCHWVRLAISELRPLPLGLEVFRVEDFDRERTA